MLIMMEILNSNSQLTDYEPVILPTAQCRPLIFVPLN